MIVTDKMLKEKYHNYVNVYCKINSEIKKGNLIRVVRGIYETNPNVSNYLLASSVCSPSYISFDFALYLYGLIPERAVNCTSATYDKRKKKVYHTSFGDYIFYDVPKNVYQYGIKIMEEGEYGFWIATPEKALCDKLYTLSPLKNLHEMEVMIFDDLRIYEDGLYKLDMNLLKEIEENYHSTNVTLFYKFMRRLKDEQDTK